jgi:hypothetical protein
MMKFCQVGLCGFLVSIAVICPLDVTAQGRRFAVRDSIEMAVFLRDPGSGKEDVRFSPDRRYFFVITTCGLLDSNELKSTIWLFKAPSVMEAVLNRSHPADLRPTPLVTMATPSSASPIIDARWGEDGKGIYFLGQVTDSERRLFAVNIGNGHLHQLSRNGQDVTDFDLNKNAAIYTEEQPVNDSELYQSAGPGLPDIQSGAGTSLFTLLYPKWEEHTFKGLPEFVWKVKNGAASPVLEWRESAPLSLTIGFTRLLSLSPSGRYAVVVCRVRSVPLSWQSYEPVL